MSNETRENLLVQVYSERFGTPLTDDEVYGYWLFVAGVVLGVVGILLFLVTGRANTTRLVAFALAGLGLAGVVTGQVIGQSFDRRAKLLVYLGAVLAVAAVAWFATIYPSGWQLGSSTATNIVLLYTVGVALVALSGVVAPVIVGQSRDRAAAQEALAASEARGGERERRVEELESELEAAEAAREEAEREAEAAREEAVAARDRAEAAEAEAAGAREEAEATAETERGGREAAEAHVARLTESNATFEMYRDKSGQWRWRLVHRNGNIIATGGESYASDRNARRGMRSVRRNALGADVFWEREEEPEPEPDPVAAEPRATFEVYEDAGGEHRWRLRHDNGNIIAASGRGFTSASDARRSLDSTRELVGPADYLTFDPTAFEVYEDAGGEYRWRLVHKNGNVLGDSGEGYATRSNARRAVDRVKELAAEATLDAEDGPGFETYEDAGGEHRWRLVAANDETVADSSEGYSSRSELEDAVERVQRYAPEADQLTVAEAALEVYEDADGEYRWRLRHRNGTILATGGEGYSDRSGAIDGVNSVKRNAPNAPVTDEGGDE